ncbi:hypothetical protein HPP92_002449 [Vanilla planifolia]|uniref:Non-haem dioxygenase N-terminal domain-containing protein n=1 Tax=Vanilla planifolia TaxID=51239 RepID=A0A835SDS8_VANPL|nr:hypothetical protein HPP92_002449 [Vanilla planifolia]
MGQFLLYFMSINTRSDLFNFSPQKAFFLLLPEYPPLRIATQIARSANGHGGREDLSHRSDHHPKAPPSGHHSGTLRRRSAQNQPLSAAAATEIVGACEELGFFKVTNHGVSHELLAKLEAESVKFFSLPRLAKEDAGAASPFGYGCREIGRKGDVGWIEYLLLEASSINPSLSSSLRSVLKEYVPAMKNLACQLLELMAEGLGLWPRNTLSRLLMDDESDLLLRLNHYPHAHHPESSPPVSPASASTRIRRLSPFSDRIAPKASRLNPEMGDGLPSPPTSPPFSSTLAILCRC